MEDLNHVFSLLSAEIDLSQEQVVDICPAYTDKKQKKTKPN